MSKKGAFAPFFVIKYIEYVSVILCNSFKINTLKNKIQVYKKHIFTVYFSGQILSLNDMVFIFYREKIAHLKTLSMMEQMLDLLGIMIGILK